MLHCYYALLFVLTIRCIFVSVISVWFLLCISALLFDPAISCVLVHYCLLSFLSPVYHMYDMYICVGHQCLVSPVYKCITVCPHYLLYIVELLFVLTVPCILVPYCCPHCLLCISALLFVNIIVSCVLLHYCLSSLSHVY